MQNMDQQERGMASRQTGAPDEALTWVTGLLRKGLTHVYAVQLWECFEPQHHVRLLERCRQGTSGTERGRQLATDLQALAQAEPRERASRLERLAPLLFDDLDRVLEQAQAAGRDRSGVHLAATRFGHEIIVLADPDAQHAWLLPTAQSRLREVLAELGIYPTGAETQELDLAQGETLQLLGHEFHVVNDRGGSRTVQCKPIEAVGPWQGEDEVALTSNWLQSLFQSLGRLFHGCGFASGMGAPAGGRRRANAAPPPPDSSTEEEDTEASSRAGRGLSARPTVPAAQPHEAREARCRPLSGWLGAWVPGWLDYTIPLPSPILLRALARQLTWLAPLAAVCGWLLWLDLRGVVLEGAVRDHGQPVAQGRVVVYRTDIPRDYMTAPVTTAIANGKYQITGLVPGSYTISVVTPEAKTQRDVAVELDYFTNTHDLDLDSMMPKRKR